MNPEPISSGIDPTVVFVFAGVWLAVALAILVWYLWAMARLFPKIGLLKRDGWIPIWNQWKLLERGGMPGWTILLSFVGLGIVPFVLLIIAMNRIGRQAGAGVGYTVLGAFIPPLWATLFANFIGSRTVSASGQQVGQAQPGFSPQALQAPQAPQHAQLGFAAPAAGFNPAGASNPQPGFAATQPPAPPQPGTVQPAFDPSVFGQPAADPFAPPAANNPYAQQPGDPYSQLGDPYVQPVDPYAQPVADPYAQPVAEPYAQPAADVHAPVTNDPYAQLGFDQLIDSVQHEQPANAPAPAQQWAAFNQNPSTAAGEAVASDMAQQGPLGSETEGDYARLAAEGFQAPPATPFGPTETASGFQWPGSVTPEQSALEPAAQEPTAQEHAAPAAPEPVQSTPSIFEPPLPPAQPPAAAPPVAAPPPAPQHAAPEAPALPTAPAVPPAPPTAPPTAPQHVASEAPAMPTPPTAPQVPPVPPAPTIPAVHPLAASSNISAPPSTAPEPALFTSAPEPSEPKLPAGTPTPAAAARKATGITGRFNPLPEAAAQEDLDRTVVAPRKSAAQQWVLELPDGTVLPLESDTVVGRRPEALEGATALAVPDSTRTLSKSHARLRFDGSSWSVEDLGSTNGLVLMHADGSESELNPGARTEATERMLFGTLEVRLRPGGDAA